MATGQLDKYKALELLKRGLTENIHEVLEDMLMTDAVNEYKEKIKPVIRDYVNKVSLRGIERFPELMCFEDEVRIYWNDEDKDHKGNTK